MSQATSAFRLFTALAGAVLAVLGALVLLPTPDDVAAQATADLPSGSFAVTGVRVFDGTRTLDHATVVVRDGRIEAVGTDIEVPGIPDDMATVDGTGRTLLPGLIDAHVHAFGDALAQSAVFGVTTVLDQFTDPGFARQIRREQEIGEANGRADLYSAGVMVTRAGGHGTQFGIAIPTLDIEPGDDVAVRAAAFVAARLAEGSDWIKIVYDAVGDPSNPEAGSRPHLDRATVAAVIDAAQEQGALAVVHVSLREAAREVLEDGADGLVHVWFDRVSQHGDPDSAATERKAIARLAKEHGAFVIPTLTVLESVSGTAGGAELASLERLAQFLPAAALGSLRQPFDVPPRAERLEIALSATTAFHRAGVPILAGTDAPNPGTAYGVSMLRELELLVRAGLTAEEALAAATSVPAASFGLDDRGRVAPGQRADLLLVSGDATTDVRALRDVVAVWKEGRLVPRQPLTVETASATLQPGLIGSFDADQGPITGDDGANAELIAADQGLGWAATTDALMGGASTAELVAHDGALIATGEVQAGFPHPWAGTIFFPGNRPMAPADLSATPRLVLRARGDGHSYRLMLFADSIGQIPAQTAFTTGEEWAEYRFDLSQLGGELEDVKALALAAGPATGTFRLEVDWVELRAAESPAAELPE